MNILIECKELWGTDYNRFTYSERRVLASMGLCLRDAGLNVTYWSYLYNGIDSVGMNYVSNPNFSDYDLVIFQNPNLLSEVDAFYRYAKTGNLWYQHWGISEELHSHGEFVDLIDLAILPHDGDVDTCHRLFPYLDEKVVSWVPPVPKPQGLKKYPYSYLYCSNPIHYEISGDPLQSLAFLEIATILYNENSRSRFFMSRGFPALWSIEEQEEYSRTVLKRSFIIKNLEIWSSLDYDYYLEKVEQSEMMLVIRDYHPGTVYVMLEAIALGCAVLCKGIPYLKDEWIIKIEPEELFSRRIDDTPERRALFVETVLNAVRNFHNSDKLWVKKAQAEVAEIYSVKKTTEGLLQWLK